MNWKSFRNITDEELQVLAGLWDTRSFEGLAEACQLALSENADHVLHQASRDVCAAHLFREVARGRVYDDEGYPLTPAKLGLTPVRYKSVVRKAFASPEGFVFRGRRVRYHLT